MTYLVVIDTNVLVSALLSKHEDASTVQIINAVFSGKIIPVFNNEILANMTPYYIAPNLNFLIRTYTIYYLLFMKTVSLVSNSLPELNYRIQKTLCFSKLLCQNKMKMHILLPKI